MRISTFLYYKNELNLSLSVTYLTSTCLMKHVINLSRRFRVYSFMVWFRWHTSVDTK